MSSTMSMTDDPLSRRHAEPSSLTLRAPLGPRARRRRGGTRG
jgi:hypothetical protein